MIAIIPARGGSKGLPGKNIKLLNGKPLIAYTIEAALKSKNITRVIVSTDDLEIAEVARKYGAEIPFMRPAELSKDNTSSKDTVIYTLNRLDEEFSLKMEEFVILQPTSPLRTDIHIDEAFYLFKAKCAHSVISYCEQHHPVSWHKYLDDEGRILDIFHKVGHQRQTEEISYFPNGAIYIYDYEMYLKNAIDINKTYAYIMNKEDSIDIDDKLDFEYCNFLMSKF